MKTSTPYPRAATGATRIGSYSVSAIAALVTWSGCAPPADVEQLDDTTTEPSSEPSVTGSSNGSTTSGICQADDVTGSGASMSQPVPFVVDEYFAPSGYMGDGEVAGNITMTPTTPEDTTSCNGDRAHAGALGSCHRVDYVPAAQNWGGIYWQYPPNNWGEMPGLAVESGATKVTFYAKGAAGNESLLFIAGGIDGDSQPYHDTFRTETMVELGTQWAQYSVDLVGQCYDDGVLGGFAWIVDGTTIDGPVAFFIDDIRWE